MVNPGRAKAFDLCAALLLALAAAATAGADVGSLAEGSLVAWGDNSSGECNVPSGYFVQMSAGGHHSLALRLDGNVAAWGLNLDGECNVPAGKFTQVSAANGGAFSLALRTDGNVAAWGRKADGECNVPAGTYTRISAGGAHGLGVKSSGSLAAWGNNAYGQCNVPAGTNYTQVAGGWFFSLALRSDGNVAAWGSNSFGECNVPVGSYTQVAAGFFTGYALRSNGSIAAWGDNGDGQCNVPAGTIYTQVAAGALHGLALRNDGNIVAWGHNGYGECNVPAGFYLAVAGGWGYSLGLKARTSYQDLLVSGTGLSALVQRSISVSGTMTIQSAMGMANNPTMAVGGKVQIKGTGAMNLQGGSLVWGPDANLGVPVENDGLLRVIAGSFKAGMVTGIDPNLLTGTTQVDANASLTAASLRQAAATVGGTLTIRGSSKTVSVLNTLNIAGATDAWTGTVDIQRNALVVACATGPDANAAYGRLANQARYAGNDLKWDRAGLTSTAAKNDANGLTAVAVVLNRDDSTAGSPEFMSSFDVVPDGNLAVPVNARCVLVKYTYYGDADLNGIVDERDLDRFATGYSDQRAGGASKGLVGWAWGDFDNNGTIDERDLDLFSTGYSVHGGPLSPGAVPEPATLAMLALAGIAAAFRGRKRGR